MTKKEHLAYIKKVHPDLDEIVKSAAYLNWLARQYPRVRDALRTGAAPEVVAALNFYRLEIPAEG